MFRKSGLFRKSVLLLGLRWVLGTLFSQHFPNIFPTKYGFGTVYVFWATPPKNPTKPNILLEKCWVQSTLFCVLFRSPILWCTRFRGRAREGSAGGPGRFRGKVPRKLGKVPREGSGRCRGRARKVPRRAREGSAGSFRGSPGRFRGRAREGSAGREGFVAGARGRALGKVLREGSGARERSREGSAGGLGKVRGGVLFLGVNERTILGLQSAAKPPCGPRRSPLSGLRNALWEDYYSGVASEKGQYSFIKGSDLGTETFAGPLTHTRRSCCHCARAFKESSRNIAVAL